MRLWRLCAGQFRRKDHATDVLSFPAAAPVNGNRPIAGDMAISVDTAARQAEQFGHPLATELEILVLHGILHLSGYDHEADNGQMARKEAGLRRRFGLGAGLIERTEAAVDRKRTGRSERERL